LIIQISNAPTTAEAHIGIHHFLWIYSRSQVFFYTWYFFILI